ncbi:MAG: hypothetical protein U5L01_07415 [Rheinheimera sp.]|nr:hypothetical protein [Rheinheimera sp.]
MHREYIVQEIEVLALPVATFSGLENGYCLGSDPATLIPDVAGGVFAGNGISENTFTPSSEFIGENVVSYSIAGENGCV